MFLCAGVVQRWFWTYLKVCVLWCRCNISYLIRVINENMRPIKCSAGVLACCMKNSLWATNYCNQRLTLLNWFTNAFTIFLETLSVRLFSVTISNSFLFKTTVCLQPNTVLNFNATKTWGYVFSSECNDYVAYFMHYRSEKSNAYLDFKIGQRTVESEVLRVASSWRAVW